MFGVLLKLLFAVLITGQFKLKNSKDRHLLAKVIPGTNEFFLANAIKPNNTVSVFKVVLVFDVDSCWVFLFFDPALIIAKKIASFLSET